MSNPTVQYKWSKWKSSCNPEGVQCFTVCPKADLIGAPIQKWLNGLDIEMIFSP